MPLAPDAPPVPVDPVVPAVPELVLPPVPTEPVVPTSCRVLPDVVRLIAAMYESAQQ